MTTIFDLVKASEITAYWQNDPTQAQPFFAESKFPNRKKLGMDLKWLKGKGGNPVALKLSALDAKAVPRSRIGFSQMSAEMPFFKESMYVDEQLRQDLNKVMETNNQVYIDTILQQVFDDEATLLEAARVARERMRMQLLTTGKITIASNGQAYDYDYGLDEKQKVTTKTSWSDPKADIITDIREWQDTIENYCGTRPTEAIMSRKTYNYLLANDGIRGTIFANAAGNAYVSEAQANTVLMSQLGLTVTILSKTYTAEDGKVAKYMPDDTVVLMPTGNLGNTWFGTTPEESDLMASSVANVSIVDTGVAVTTTEQTDPVNVETKVSQICMPDFPMADYIMIADVIAD